MERVTFEQPETSGEHTQKGKRIDPSNWGNIHLSEAEGDTATQEALLSDYNLHRHEQDDIQLECQEAEASGYEDWQSVPDQGDEPPDEANKEPNQESEPDIFTWKEFTDYLRNSGALKKLLDRYNKKLASGHRKKKDRAGSLPISDELERLIKRVAEGSVRKSNYKPVIKSKAKPNHVETTKLISQVAAKSALGRALAQLYRDDSSSSSSSSDSESVNNSDPSLDDKEPSSDSSASSTSTGSEGGRSRRHR
ncbi:hypothetical protein C0993_011481 [Termitomyces sp. T159_Od127]|nr:hypothetical protein C0993_011481 [Termitomyces sp. T159_Od127]